MCGPTVGGLNILIERVAIPPVPDSARRSGSAAPGDGASNEALGGSANEAIRGIPFLTSGLDDVEYGEFPATTRCCSPWQIGRNALQPVAEPDEFAVARRLGSECPHGPTTPTSVSQPT